MPGWPGKDAIAVVSACMRCDGTPALVLNEVVVTKEEAENGIHYYLVEAELLQAGFEEPFVHFDQMEAPPFLHAAVRQSLGQSPTVNQPSNLALSEKS